MDNTTSIMTSERSQPSIPIFPPELWIEVANNLRINDQHSVIFPGYNRPDKLVLGRLSLCNKSFRQLLEPMMWEVVLLSPDGDGWFGCLARVTELIQSNDRASWVKYFAFGGFRFSGAHTITPGGWNTIETLFQRLPNLYGVHITGLNITFPIATALFQLPKLRYVELHGISCDVDCSNSHPESFQITEFRVIGGPYETHGSSLIQAVARSDYLAKLMIKTDKGWHETRGVLQDHINAPFTHLKTLALPQPIEAADFGLLSTFGAQFAAVTALELYPPQLLSGRNIIALESVPIPDTVFPNLQSFHGTLYMAKKFTPKRPIYSLVILCGNSSLPHEDLVHLTTGSMPLTAFRVRTAHYMENCIRDVAQTFPNLEDLTVVITSNDQPREDPWPISELEPLRKLRKLRLGRPWHSNSDIFIDDQDMTRTKVLISTLQQNHSDISTINVNRNLEWGRVGAAWKIVNLDQKSLVGPEERARFSALEVLAE